MVTECHVCVMLGVVVGLVAVLVRTPLKRVAILGASG